MEKTVVDFFQISENSNMTVGMTPIKKTPYVSYIRINGKPILPPLISEENRKELQKYKQKAIEMELKLARQKKKNTAKSNQIPSEISSIVNVPPSRQSTPARPVTLNLNTKASGKTYVLSKSRTEGSLDKFAEESSLGSDLSSHLSANNLEKIFRSTLEQRLAIENSLSVKNKLNKYHQSPIIEEKCLDSDSDSVKDIKPWSPLKIDSINSLKIKLPEVNARETDENLEMSLDESQNTPETVTQSPSLMRQNSYTLLTPSPALLNFLESQKEAEVTQRSHSGRKTWDLSNAKKNWDPNVGSLRKSSEDEDSDDRFLSKKNSSSLDSFSAYHNDPDQNEYSMQKSAYDSGTSPDSYSRKSLPKIKCKLKGKKARSLKSMPSPKSLGKVPFKDHRDVATPLEVKTELSDLSELLLKLKVDHERQKKELEEKQQTEIRKLQIILQRKEAELLSKVNQLPRKYTKSIYSQSSWGSGPQEPDAGMMGDGSHNRAEREKPNLINDHCLNQYTHGRRPHSAKDFHPKFHSRENDCTRRARSMDFNQGNHDTDLDISFKDDFSHSKDTTLNNEYMIESDSISNFSSHSSTFSSDNRHFELSIPRKFQGVSSEDFAKYNQAATIITAAARGFLTRRLLRTSHVQGLIVTLKDAITCATQLHGASDLADSDIDLMRRLSRQIEAAWDAVYSVFFCTDTTTRLQLISTDRERLRAAVSKNPVSTVKKKRISSATRKSLDRKKGGGGGVGSFMSKSQTSNGFSRVRTCTKMAASYPSPYFPQKLK